MHLNLGDAHGNAAYTGIDPYFDDLFLMAAERRFLSVEKVVSTEELVESRSAAGAADQPDDGRQRRRGARTAPTSPPPNPTTAATRSSSATTPKPPDPTRPGSSSSATYLSGSEADYQAAVRAFKADQEASSDLRQPAPKSAPSPAPNCSATPARSWSARWRPSCRSAPGWPG